MSKIQDDPTASEEAPLVLDDSEKVTVTDADGEKEVAPSNLQLESVKISQLSTQPSQEAPKELSEAEWRKIMKVDLKDRPKIQHPTLGEVVEVAPGVVARQVSAEEAYNKHLATIGDNKMPTDELEHKRFTLMISARNNKDTNMIAELEKARTKEDMELAIGNSLKKLRGIEHLAQQESVKKMFENNEAEAKQVYEALKKDGRVMKLEKDWVTKEKTITPEAVEQLRRRGVNVFTRRMPGSDPYMNKVRADAELALQFANQRLAVFPNGLDETSTEEQRKELMVAAQASAHALARLDAERDTITRGDGEEITVRVNFPEFYASMKSQHIETLDLRQFLHEHGHQIGMAMRHGEAKSSHTLVFLELLDCAVFVPRLCLAMVNESMPRVVEFSRVYNVYRATTDVLKFCKLLKTRKENAKISGKRQRELKKKIDESNDDVSFSKNHNNEKPWMQREVSVGGVSDGFGEMRLSARTSLLENVRALTAWFASESRYHAGTSSTSSTAKETWKPTFTRGEFEADATVLVRYFYFHVWNFVQRFAGDLLRAYEFSILLQLNQFIPRSTAEFWSSSAKIPDSVRCPGVTQKLVKEKNAQLTRWRTFSSAVIDSLVAKKIKIDLSFPSTMAEERVDPQTNWSPTFAEMAKYYRDMASLFVLSKKQVNRLVTESAKKIDSEKKKDANGVKPTKKELSDAADDVVEREEDEI